jgi:hypothetical protein
MGWFLSKPISSIKCKWAKPHFKVCRPISLAADDDAQWVLFLP